MKKVEVERMVGQRAGQTTKVWSRNFTLAVVVNTFLTTVFLLLMTSMALYAIEMFDASEPVAGLASSLFVIGTVVARVIAGSTIHLVGMRPLLWTGIVTFALGSAAYAAVDSMPALLVLRFAHGAAFGVASTVLTALVQQVVPPARRGEGTAYFGLSVALGSALGPWIALSLMADGRSGSLFFLCSAFSVVILVVSSGFNLPKVRASRPIQPRSRRGLRIGAIVDVGSVQVSMVMFVIVIGYSGFVTFLGPYADELGVTAASGVFFVFYAIAVIVSRLFVGRVQDRWGPNWVMYPSLICFSASLFVLAIPLTVWTMALAGVLAGAGFATLSTAVQTIVVTRAPIERVGIVISTYWVVFDVAAGIGPLVLGWLLHSIEYSTMFLLLGVLMVVAPAWYWRTSRAYARGDARDVQLRAECTQIDGG